MKTKVSYKFSFVRDDIIVNNDNDNWFLYSAFLGGDSQVLYKQNQSCTYSAPRNSLESILAFFWVTNNIHLFIYTLDQEKQCG